MNILDYADKVREAVENGDKEQLDKVEKEFGEQQAKLKDVEELNAKTVAVIASIITQETMLNSYKLDLIITALAKKELISEEDIQEMNGTLEQLIDQLQGNETKEEVNE